MTHIQIINPTLYDKNRLQEFYAQIYRPDHVLMNDAFLQWWLRDNPFWKGDGFSCKIAVDGEKIVGHFAYVPVSIWAMGKIYSGVWTGNFIVDEFYRWRGIGGALIKSIMDEYQATMDVGANAPAEIILQKKGWMHFGNLHRFVGIFDEQSAAPLAIKKEAPGHCLIRVPDGRDNQTAISEVAEFSDDYDAFWEKFRQGIAAATDRSAKFLNWRYVKHPLFQYRMLEAKSGGQTTGIAVYRIDPIKDMKRPAMRIVEFFAEPEAEDALLTQLLELAKKENVVLADFFCASKKFGAALARFGFCAQPYSSQIARLFYPIVLSAREISFNGANCQGGLPKDIFKNQELWYVTSGDGDQDRPNYK